MPYDGESVAASTSRASNAGGPPCCRYSWRMSGVFAKKFGGRTAPVDDLRHELVELRFVFFHVKYV
jgi:hypothetical protein